MVRYLPTLRVMVSWSVAMKKMRVPWGSMLSRLKESAIDISFHFMFITFFILVRGLMGRIAEFSFLP